MSSLYVQRDAGGKIVGAYTIRQRGFAEEPIPADAPEAVAFLARFGQARVKATPATPVAPAGVTSAGKGKRATVAGGES